MTTAGRRLQFHQLHATDELFVIPNPWDTGSAVRLEEMGFKALATTSSGFAASLGRTDGEVTLDELVTHTAALAAATTVPINVDSERCFSETAAGVAVAVHRLAEAGAAGLSIEDWDADHGLDPLDVATERVRAAATPPIAELADLGIRRVSTGGALAFGAYKAMVDQAQAFLDW